MIYTENLDFKQLVMKKILLGLIVLFTISCNNDEKINNNIDTTNNDIVEINNENLAIKSILKDKILQYIQRQDSIAKIETNFN